MNRGTDDFLLSRQRALGLHNGPLDRRQHEKQNYGRCSKYKQVEAAKEDEDVWQLSNETFEHTGSCRQEVRPVDSNDM